jgi:hypothetical protein
MVDAYLQELERRRMPSTWPKSDLLFQASLLYGEEPMTMVLYAPLKLQPMDQDSLGPNVYIAGAYTRPSWRRAGLYSDLMRIMINQWRLEDAYDWLRSGFHLNNQASREMQMRQGREFYEIRDNHQRTRLSLRPTGEEFEFSKETLRPILNKLDRLSG